MVMLCNHCIALTTATTRTWWFLLLSDCSFQWVVPTDSGQDCVIDQSSQQRSDLLAITSDLRLCWYSVCEGREADDGTHGSSEASGTCEGRDSSGACDTGGIMIIERLALISNKNLLSKLKKLKHSKSIPSNFQPSIFIRMLNLWRSVTIH